MNAGLPDFLQLKGLSKLTTALETISSGGEGCSQTVDNVGDLVPVLKQQMKALVASFTEADESMEVSEPKGLGGKLVGVFSKGVCFVQTATNSVVQIVDDGLEKITDFVDSLEIGMWEDPPDPDCTGDEYYCLVPVERSSDIYRMFFFPVEHINFWDLTAPPLFNPCADAGERLLAGTGEMAFRWTVPGLVSKYAAQSSTFLQLRHTTCNGMVPNLYVYGYRPMVERANPSCRFSAPEFVGCSSDWSPAYADTTACVGRASLFAILDGYGNVLHKKELMQEDGWGKWSGSLTGIAMRTNTEIGFMTETPLKGTVYACGQASGNATWEVIQFDLADVAAANGVAISIKRRYKMPWLNQIGAERCTLTYEPEPSGLLWVGAVVSQGKDAEEDAEAQGDKAKGHARPFWPARWPFEGGQTEGDLKVAPIGGDEGRQLYGPQMFDVFDSLAYDGPKLNYGADVQVRTHRTRTIFLAPPNLLLLPHLLTSFLILTSDI